MLDAQGAACADDVLVDVRDARDPALGYAVERRLVARARSRGALRAALARVAARAVERRIWEPLGYVRLADYAREWLGVSGREVQDLAIAGTRLERLPAVEAALRRGEIPWSKARLVARVATAEDEGAWLALARRRTASALEKQTRAVDTGSLEGGPSAPGVFEIDPNGPGRGVRIACTRRASAKWWRVRELARRTAGHSLSNTECSELLAAEVLSAIPLEEGAGAEDGDGGATGGASWAAVHRADAGEDEPVEGEGDAESAPAFEIPCVPLNGLDDAGPRELHARLRELRRREQRLDAEIGALLAIVHDRRIYRALGFATQERYAKERLGFSGRKARALLRVERAARRCRALAAAYRKGELSSVQAEVLVPLVLVDAGDRFGAGWVAHARRVTVRRLRDDVDRALVLVEADPQHFAQGGGLPERSADGTVGGEDLDALLRRIGASESVEHTLENPRVEDAQLWFQGPADFVSLMRALICTVRRRIERVTGALPTRGEAVEAMLDHALEAWGADVAHRKLRREHRVFERDGWRCRVPGCSSRRNLHAHHVVFRSAGGGHELSNLATLCAGHHLRGVHGGIVGCTGKAPDGLYFELALARYGPGEVLLAAS